MAKDKVRNLVASRTKPRDRYKPDSTHGTLLDLSARLNGIAENYGDLLRLYCWCGMSEMGRALLFLQDIFFLL
jgi:hypothetical protein